MSGVTKDWRLDCKVYIGELGYGAAKQEIEDVFSRHGVVKNVWVARNPPGFAFVEFDDPRDAQDAVDALDGSEINHRRVVVEMSNGKSRWGHDGPPQRRGGSGRARDRDFPRRRRSRSRSPRRRSVSPSLRRKRSRSRSRSRSPAYRRSRSPYGRKRRDW